MKLGAGIVPGEPYRRTGGVRIVFMVVAFDQRRGLPPHARLDPEGEPGAPALPIGLSALRDPRFWTRLPAPV